MAEEKKKQDLDGKEEKKTEEVPDEEIFRIRPFGARGFQYHFSPQDCYQKTER